MAEFQSPTSQASGKRNWAVLRPNVHIPSTSCLPSESSCKPDPLETAPERRLIVVLGQPLNIILQAQSLWFPRTFASKQRAKSGETTRTEVGRGPKQKEKDAGGE